jgi:prevent-host-death family protein
MHVSVTSAKAQLTDLVRRAEAGEEVVLTRHGQPAVRLTPVERARQTSEARRAIIERISREAAARAKPGPCAARSQDFLYEDDTGLPG